MSPMPNTPSNCLVTHFGEVGEDVAANGIGQVVKEVSIGALAGGNSLGTISEHGKHGQAAVPHLLQLKLIHASLGLTQVGQVEPLATGVSGVAAAGESRLDAKEVLLRLRTGVLVILPALKLSELHGDNLHEEDCVRISPVLVVGACGRDNTGAEPDSLIGCLGDGTNGGQDLRSDASGSAQHSPAAMEHFGVREPCGVNEATCALGVRETQRIKAEITRERAVEVAQRLVRSEVAVKATNFLNALYLGKLVSISANNEARSTSALRSPDGDLAAENGVGAQAELKGNHFTRI